MNIRPPRGGHRSSVVGLQLLTAFWIWVQKVQIKFLVSFKNRWAAQGLTSLHHHPQFAQAARDQEFRMSERAPHGDEV